MSVRGGWEGSGGAGWQGQRKGQNEQYGVVAKGTLAGVLITGWVKGDVLVASEVGGLPSVGAYTVQDDHQRNVDW